MFDSTVLGVDPGVSALGLAVVARLDRRPDLRFATTVRTTSDLPEALRLRRIHEVVRDTIAVHAPDSLAVTGQGTADKAQVRAALARLHGLREVPSEPDAADAVAVAVCHLTQTRLKRATRAAT